MSSLHYHNYRFKTGAASFYVVAISTLILVVLAISFATAVLAEIIRSSSDDLAQSAYDAAMAGVEEAKLAYENYRNCINLGYTVAEEPNSDGDISCQEIIYWMEHLDCDMVAHILGRIKDNEEGREINLEETATGQVGGRLDQAYTCVEIDINPQDIFGTLNVSTPYEVIKLDDESISSAETITIEWHKNGDGSNGAYTDIVGNDVTEKVAFFPTSEIFAPTPATISLELIQVPKSSGFTFDQLSGASSNDHRTNRATMYFVPTNNITMARNNSSSTTNYIGIYDNTSQGINYLSADNVASNNTHSKNLPYATYCDTSNAKDFACSVTIQLPKPLSAENRRKDNFYLVLSLPYGAPATDYSISYACVNDACQTSSGSNSSDAPRQIVIDSTGRASNLFKRIEVRLDTGESSSIISFPYFAIQANTVNKNFAVNNEYGVGDIPTPTPQPEPDGKCNYGVPSMQQWSDNLAMGETTQLCDNRDGKQYSVSKLKDGKVWMTTNLDLTGGTILTSDNTDFQPGYTLPTDRGWTVADGGLKLPVSSTNGFMNSADDIAPFVYNSNNNVCDGLSPCYSYYSWDAATVGSGRKLTQNSDAPYSICPKGWKLPTSKTTNYSNWQTLSDYYIMASKYGATNYSYSMTDAEFIAQAGPGTTPNFVFTGMLSRNNYSDGSCGVGSKPYNPPLCFGNIGGYWSSTAYRIGNLSNSFTFNTNGNVYTYYSNGRTGLAVRCIKR